MKKSLFMAVFCLAQLTSNAQLVVDSLGKVGIGTETPGNVLHINRMDSSIVSKMPAAGLRQSPENISLLARMSLTENNKEKLSLAQETSH